MQAATDFSSIFKISIARENLTKLNCHSCRQMTSTRVRRQLTGAQLPPILTVNTAVHTSDQMEIWLDMDKKGLKSRFLQPCFAINHAGTVITSLESGHTSTQEGLVIYELQVRSQNCTGNCSKLNCIGRPLSRKYKLRMTPPTWFLSSKVWDGCRWLFL